MIKLIFTVSLPLLIASTLSGCMFKELGEKKDTVYVSVIDASTIHCHSALRNYCGLTLTKCEDGNTYECAHDVKVRYDGFETQSEVNE